MTDAQNQVAQILQAAIDKGDFVPSLLASRIHRRLLEENPELLDTWLRERASSFLSEEIGKILRSQRAAAMHRKGPRLFTEAIESDNLTIFDARFTVDKTNTSRRLGDMTGEDHNFVATRYRKSGNTALLMAEFHLAVARKVGSKRTEEVFSPVELEKLQRTIFSTLDHSEKAVV